MATWPSAGMRLQRRLVAGLEADRAEPAGEQAAGGLGQVAELALLLAEALHDPHAADGLVDDAGDDAGLLLGVPGGGEDRASGCGATRSSSSGPTARATSVSSGDRNTITTSETTKSSTLPMHDRQERQQALDQADVRRWPRRPAGRSAAGRGGRSRGAGGGRRWRAQVVLDVEADPAAHEAADEGGGEAGDAGQQQDDEPGRERRGAGDDAVVDDRLLDERRQRGDDLADARGAQRRSTTLRRWGRRADSSRRIQPRWRIVPACCGAGAVVAALTAGPPPRSPPAARRCGRRSGHRARR